MWWEELRETDTLRNRYLWLRGVLTRKAYERILSQNQNRQPSLKDRNSQPSESCWWVAWWLLTKITTLWLTAMIQRDLLRMEKLKVHPTIRPEPPACLQICQLKTNYRSSNVGDTQKSVTWHRRMHLENTWNRTLDPFNAGCELVLLKRGSKISCQMKRQYNFNSILVLFKLIDTPQS